MGLGIWSEDLGCGSLGKKEIDAVDYTHERGLKAETFEPLRIAEWIAGRENLIITGPSGVGKSHLLTILGRDALRAGFSVAFYRVSRLVERTRLGRETGDLIDVFDRIARTDLLVVDDWGLTQLNPTELRDIFDVIEDRSGHRSTAIASQLAVDNWHDWVGDVHLARALVDRITQNAHVVRLQGESLRKKPITAPGVTLTQVLG